jgi:hypothetical protein
MKQWSWYPVRWVAGLPLAEPVVQGGVATSGADSADCLADRFFGANEHATNFAEGECDIRDGPLLVLWVVGIRSVRRAPRDLDRRGFAAVTEPGCDVADGGSTAPWSLGWLVREWAKAIATTGAVSTSPSDLSTKRVEEVTPW